MYRTEIWDIAIQKWFIGKEYVNMEDAIADCPYTHYRIIDLNQKKQVFYTKELP